MDRSAGRPGDLAEGSSVRGLTSTKGRGPASEWDGEASLRVQAARSRIASGYYDRDDVREQLVGAILEELTRS